MKKEPIFDLFLGLKIYIEVALCNFFLINLIFGLIILKFQNCEKQSYYIAIITTICFHDQWQVNCRQIEFHWKRDGRIFLLRTEVGGRVIANENMNIACQKLNYKPSKADHDWMVFSFEIPEDVRKATAEEGEEEHEDDE